MIRGGRGGESGFRLGREEQRGIDAGVVETDAPVEVRTSGAPGHADGRKRFTLGNVITFFHIDGVEMAIHGNQFLAVIDEYSPAVVVELTGLNDGTLCWSQNLSALRGCDVEAAVGCTCLIVEEAAQAERAAQTAIDRGGEQ